MSVFLLSAFCIGSNFIGETKQNSSEKVMIRASLVFENFVLFFQKITFHFGFFECIHSIEQTNAPSTSFTKHFYRKCVKRNNIWTNTNGNFWAAHTRNLIHHSVVKNSWTKWIYFDSILFDFEMNVVKVTHELQQIEHRIRVSQLK